MQIKLHKHSYYREVQNIAKANKIYALKVDLI